MIRMTALLLLLLPGIAATAQDTDAVQVYVIDSIEATPYEINGLGPDQIAMITIARGKKTVEKYGERAANGVFYIETKAFARQRYNRMFSQLSPAYAAALQQYGSDSSFQYILGSSPVTSNQESQLAAVEKKDIKGVRVLDAATLKKEYEVEGKQVGVVVDMK